MWTEWLNRILKPSPNDERAVAARPAAIEFEYVPGEAREAVREAMSPVLERD